MQVPTLKIASLYKTTEGDYTIPSLEEYSEKGYSDKSICIIPEYPQEYSGKISFMRIIMSTFKKVIESLTLDKKEYASPVTQDDVDIELVNSLKDISQMLEYTVNCSSFRNKEELSSYDAAEMIKYLERATYSLKRKL